MANKRIVKITMKIKINQTDCLFYLNLCDNANNAINACQNSCMTI